ncbi:MAG: hypothetical protein QM691_01495 [Opitutaceae bacterium]
MKTLFRVAASFGHSGSFSALLVLAAVASWPSVAPARTPPPAEAPPSFADTTHVPRGCYLSSVAFLARFRAAFPAECGEPLTIRPASFDGPHTIALITWGGTWWGRDEYFGTFPLSGSFGEPQPAAELQRQAAQALDRLAARHLRRGWGSIPRAAANSRSSADRRRVLATAAALLPGTSEIVDIPCSGNLVPFLFFRPSAGVIAVYDPALGTATARCASPDAVCVVREVAVRLGYRLREEASAKRDYAFSPD